MITDDPRDMEQKLTQYVKDARQALEMLEELSPSNIIPTRPNTYIGDTRGKIAILLGQEREIRGIC